MSEHAAPFVASRQSPRDYGDVIPEWRPFPVDALPKSLRDLSVEGARAIGCDSSFVAVPALTAAASAVGNSRTIELKPTWREPCVVWGVTIGESGSAKSPSEELALAPLRECDATAQRAYQAALDAYKPERQRYEAQLGTWKKNGGNGKPPREPSPPRGRRYTIGDVTVEAVASRLVENPRGLLLARDELSGFLRSFDAYRGGKGGDVAFWLSAHGARSHLVDRKGEPPTIYVPRAAVSIIGGIPPATFASCIGREHFEDGMVARFVLAMPPRRPLLWTTASVAPKTLKDYAQTFEDFLALAMVTDASGEPRPVAVTLTDEAAIEWEKFHNGIRQRQAAAIGAEAAALAKVVGYGARFALIHHLAQQPDGRVDDDSIRAGACLAEWFADELVRVYAVLNEPEDAAERRRLVEWIASPPRSGRVTARDLARGPREYRRPHAADDALVELVSAGHGEWRDRETRDEGGRPTREFVLRRSAPPDGGDAATATKPPEPPSSDEAPGDGTPAPEAAPPGSVAVASGGDSRSGASVAMASEKGEVAR